MGKNKHHTKKINKQKSHQTKKHKGGCDAPFIPDTDGVWERTNGIKSGTFYDLLQFYKFIDWTTCDQMYKLGKDTKLSSNKVTSLQAITEAKLNANFRGYTIYDTTNQIENQSHSFIFGNAKVDTVNKKVIFKQAPKDRIGDKMLKYSFNYMDEINLIIEKEKKEIFIFSAKDAKFTLGLKTGLEMPTTRINKIKDAMRQNRKTIEETEDQLTQTQKKDRQIFANRSKKGISNSMNTGGARTKTRKYKNQRGGANPKIYTISNSGVPPNEQGMSNQCLWISISDYFKYHKNETKSVRDLKAIGGIQSGNRKYDNTEFDIYEPDLKENIEKICIDSNLNLSLHFIYIYKGQIAKYCLSNNDKTIEPFQIINPDGKNKIYIATYGRHFELIVRIGEEPNTLYRLNKHDDTSDDIVGKQYKEKVEIESGEDSIKKIFIDSTELINLSEKKELELASIIISAELFQKNIETFNKEIAESCLTKETKSKKIIEFNNLKNININLYEEIHKNTDYTEFIEGQQIRLNRVPQIVNNEVLAHQLHAENEETELASQLKIST
jgi:hypothetical protein